MELNKEVIDKLEKIGFYERSVLIKKTSTWYGRLF